MTCPDCGKQMDLISGILVCPDCDMMNKTIEEAPWYQGDKDDSNRDETETPEAS